MNDKLTSSLTRHTAVLERRRIARLKGEPAGDLPDVNYRSKDTEPASKIMLTHTPDTQAISDTIDRTVFPAYEHSDIHRPYSFLMPYFPAVEEITTQAHDRESTVDFLARGLSLFERTRRCCSLRTRYSGSGFRATDRGLDSRISRAWPSDSHPFKRGKPLYMPG